VGDQLPGPGMPAVPSSPAVQGRELAGPTVLRMLVGAQLRRLREAACISTEAAGYEIRGSHSKISRIELGRVGFKERDIADLLTLYGVTDTARRQSLLQLVKHANTPAWWQRYGDVVPSWFEPYLGLEQGAEIIRSYEVQAIPELLQTEEYARALTRARHPDASAEEVERRVELRMLRGRILTQPARVKFWAVLDEAALRRAVGGVPTMRAQLRHLCRLAEEPNITVQVLPFAAGGHAGEGGPVTILRFAEPELPDVVYIEQLAGAFYPDRPAEVVRYRDVMNRLGVQAQAPARTPAILHHILTQL